jgi:ferrous iron transport protein A
MLWVMAGMDELPLIINSKTRNRNVTMAKINLTEAVKGISYRISGFTDQESDYSDKLSKMGFITGTPIELAPVAISDPMVIQIRGSRIALRRQEAKEILVEGI